MQLYVFGNGNLGFADFVARYLAPLDALDLSRCTHFLAFDQSSDARRKSGTLRNIEACAALGRVRLGVAATS